MEVERIIEDNVLGTRILIYMDGAFDVQEYVPGIGWVD